MSPTCWACSPNPAVGRAARGGQALLHEALGHVEQTQARAAEAELYRLQGQLRLGSPRPDEAEAEALFLRALEVARWQKADGGAAAADLVGALV